MKKIDAFIPDFDCRLLFHTARSAREAEFDHLVIKIGQHIPLGDGQAEWLQKLANQLRCGVYNSGVDAFLKAADYLREHLAVMTGSAVDPEENRYEP